MRVIGRNEYFYKKGQRQMLKAIEESINDLDTTFVELKSDFIGGDIMIKKEDVLNLLEKETERINNE